MNSHANAANTELGMQRHLSLGFRSRVAYLNELHVNASTIIIPGVN